MLHVWQASAQGSLRVWQAQQRAWQTVTTWQKLSEVVEEKAVCLYLPTQTILSLSSQLSASQLKQLGDSGKQYLFEEISLTPVEQLRVKTLNEVNQDIRYLYAAAISDLETWQQRADLAGFEVIAALPDFVLLPIPELSPGVLQGSKVNIYHDSETTLVRQSKNYGFAVSYLPGLLQSMPDLAEVGVVAPILDSSNSSSTNETFITDDSINSLSIDTNNEKLDESTPLYSVLESQDVLSYPISTKLEPVTSPLRHSLNFITKERQSNISSYLKVAMLTALCAGIVQISADALQVYQYSRGTQAVKQATNQQFAHWFGGESLNERVTVPLQVKPYLKADRASQTPQFDILNQLSPLIKQSNLTTESLNWDDQNVTLKVSSEQRAGLDSFVNALTQQGLDATLGRIESRDNGNIVGEVNVALLNSTDVQVADNS